MRPDDAELFNSPRPDAPRRLATRFEPAVGLLLSGGLDSAMLLGHLLGQQHRVQPLYVRSNLVWEREELRAVDALLAAMARPGLLPLAVLDMPLEDVYGGHWSVNGRGTPDASSADEAVYLPGRNPLLLVKPMVWCGLRGIEQLALAVLGTNPFADATPRFFRVFESALELATGSRVRVIRPLEGMTKHEAMRQAGGVPLELSFSCIAPADGRHCGQCNKCAERAAGFAAIGQTDPTVYAAAPSGAMPTVARGPG